jgi:hypothetical protein
MKSWEKGSGFPATRQAWPKDLKPRSPAGSRIHGGRHDRNSLNSRLRPDDGRSTLAVVAVHRLKDTAQADQRSTSEMPRFSDHNLFVIAKRLHVSP